MRSPHGLLFSFPILRYNSGVQRILSEEFFKGDTLAVSRALLGKFLVRRKGNRRIAAMITEVEAYNGPYDRASHASRGRTKRTAVMFGPPGFWYVYVVYGMHHCVNIVTGPNGYPAAVLIRSVHGVTGPGRVARHFGIDRRLNNKKAGRASGLWVEDRGIRIPKRSVGTGKRIGVEYAGKWKNKLWRYYLYGGTL